MSSVHVARQGFITKSALPSVSRARGSTTVADNRTVLLLNGNGTNRAQNNTFVTDNFGTGGQGNYSVAFDGTGDFLSLTPTSALDFTGDFTVECWFYSTLVSASEQAIVDTRTSVAGTFGYFIGVTTSTGVVRVVLPGSTIIASNTTITANTWNHIAVCRSGSTIRSYVNGVQQSGSATISTTITTYLFNIGAKTYTSSGLINFNGYISNFRVVNGTAVYTTGFTPPTSNLTAISGTSLLTCQSSHIVDNSTNNFAITANGDAKVATNTSSVPIAITRNGNATQGSFSPFTLPDGQWSNFFDGTGDTITAADNAAFDVGANNWTIECWANFSDVSGEKGLVSHFSSSGGNNGYVLRLSTGNSPSGLRLVCATTSTSAVLQAAWTPIVGTWYHIAAVRDSSTLRLYVDGVQIGSTSIAITIGNPATPFAVGTAQTVASSDMNGYISNVRLVNGTCLYTGGTTFTPPTTPLTAITNTSLLTCQSNRFRDNSSNNFAITRNGDVRVTPWSPFAPTSAYDPATNGGSGYFDGTDDTLTVATTNTFAAANEDFTLEFWVYKLSSGSFQMICGWTNNPFDYCTVESDNKLSLNMNNNYTVTTAANAITNNSWNHVAFTRSSNTVRIFVNGVQSGSNFTVSTSFGQANNLRIGNWQSSPNYFLNGYLSNFRFVKGTAVYTSAFTPPTAPVTNITNTSLLLNFTNAGIFDTAGDNVIETVGNAQIDTAIKKYGSGSLEFDGNTDALIISNNTPLLAFGSQNFTVECWFRRNNTNNVATIFRGDSGGGGGTGLEIIFDSSNNLIMGLNGGAPNIVTVSSGTHGVTTNTWYHGAFVRNGNTWTIYVNGVAVGSATNTSTISTPTFYRVGSNSFSATMSFNGYIDDFRVTLGQARYTANFTPPTAELITYGTSENIVNNSTYGVYQLA